MEDANLQSWTGDDCSRHNVVMPRVNGSAELVGRRFRFEAEYAEGPLLASIENAS